MMRVPTPALWWLLSGAVIFLGAILTIPALQRLFSFAPLHPNDLTLSVLAGVVCLVWFELLKYFDCLKLEPS